MRTLGLILLVGLLSLLRGDEASVLRWSAGPGGKAAVQYHNHLGAEKSPYLLQHKDNPVHWFAWGNDALRAARAENRLIFLSIGYSTCHWCHVMEHDSFERQDVADVLNRHFISIKVDREEHPEIDQIYMDAVVAMTGHGGWPMSVFLTPDTLQPVYGGTFFWRAQFMQLLNALATAWMQEPERVRGAGAAVTAHLRAQSAHTGSAAEPTDDLLRAASRDLERRFDARHGGFGDAPKFPPSQSVRLLLRLHRRSGDAHALQMATATLDAMARGGIYDHLGGGFARYATDAQWLVPHFEKMLYDNALLAEAYAEAYQATGKPMYAAVLRETLDYILRDMADERGGFYSAEDADSEGVEGKFYVWTLAALRTLLAPDELAAVRRVYHITETGNFEHGTNILHLAGNDDWAVKAGTALRRAHDKLLAARGTRVRPHRDDKILTAWNGLMIGAMAKGHQVLGDARYLAAAQAAARLVRDHLDRDRTLLRRYRDGDARHAGTLNDYAYLIQGLLALYQSDGHADWLDWAQDLQRRQDTALWDEKAGGYFFAPAGPDLLVRAKEWHDGAIPSGNAVALDNLQRLFAFTLDVAWHERASVLRGQLAARAAEMPAGYAAALLACDFHLDAAKEVAVVGTPDDPQLLAMRQHLFTTFLPNTVWAIGPTDSAPLLRDRPMIAGKATVYVCERNICLTPTTDIDAAKGLIGAVRTYQR